MTVEPAALPILYLGDAHFWKVVSLVKKQMRMIIMHQATDEQHEQSSKEGKKSKSLKYRKIAFRILFTVIVQLLKEMVPLVSKGIIFLVEWFTSLFTDS